MEKRLGRGLGALLPGKDMASTGGSQEIALGRIRPNPFQPRRHFDSEGIEELRQSIENHGILQPVVVRPQAGGFELISGERRCRAAKAAGLRAIPAIVREGVEDTEMLELALVENVQRRDLSPLERAEGFHSMMNQLGLSQDQVAGMVGLQRSTVANHVRLLELPPAIQRELTQGALTMGHAKALLSMKDAEEMETLAQTAVAEGWSVRETERRCRGESPTAPAAKESKSSKPKAQPESDREITPTVPWVVDLERRMQEHLGTKVQIQNGPQYRGKITIEYFDRDDLERLLRMLVSDDQL